MKHRIEFDLIPWTIIRNGMKEKLIESERGQMQLVRFEKGFEEADWCTKGHLGYIIDGEMSIDFDGETLLFKKGDGLHIPKGEATKHKGSVEDFVELVLFEEL